jgi:hypothetical protein
MRRQNAIPIADAQLSCVSPRNAAIGSRAQASGSDATTIRSSINGQNAIRYAVHTSYVVHFSEVSAIRVNVISRIGRSVKDGSVVKSGKVKLSVVNTIRLWGELCVPQVAGFVFSGYCV